MERLRSDVSTLAEKTWRREVTAAMPSLRPYRFGISTFFGSRLMQIRTVNFLLGSPL